MEQEDLIQSAILVRYGNPHQDETCACRSGKRLVRCRWDGCFQYPTSCEKCFVENHRFNPFHWALVWDASKQVWIKKDYSELLSDNFIQLGHVGEGKKCSGSSPIPFQISHTNGIHSTCINFCGCPFAKGKLEQLILADLFPSTPSDTPRSAFTICLLKHFRMHNLQSKCGAFDFMTSIRRLTNGTFTSKVHVCRLFFATHNLSNVSTESIQELLTSDENLGHAAAETLARSTLRYRSASSHSIKLYPEHLLPVVSRTWG